MIINVECFGLKHVLKISFYSGDKTELRRPFQCTSVFFFFGAQGSPGCLDLSAYLIQVLFLCLLPEGGLILRSKHVRVI